MLKGWFRLRGLGALGGAFWANALLETSAETKRTAALRVRETAETDMERSLSGFFSGGRISGEDDLVTAGGGLRPRGDSSRK